MTERWRSPAARNLARAVRRAGGTIDRAGVGKLRITGPGGSVTIHEPGSQVRPDKARDDAARKIRARTGLEL